MTQNNKKYTLTSFALCPYVQRSIITLKHKKIDFEIKYIELSNKPEWFLKLSPLGKVPILELENTVLFESAVINEFLDEDTQGSMLSENLIEKAEQRAWIEFSSSLNMESYHIVRAKDEKTYNQKIESITNKLKLVEKQIKGKYFSGDKFSLVDSSYAPFFMRLFTIEKMKNDIDWTQIPKVFAWAETLLALDEVKTSVKETFKEDYIGYIKKENSYIYNN
ncbi:MAG: glutathione S-transferase family protein [Nanoarchaeales archaeon]|nr:glutathione S-transferase family protein [Nanoarchaeales archaeon]